MTAVHIPGQLSFEDAAGGASAPPVIAETAPTSILDRAETLDGPASESPAPLTVEVIRSAKRRKTAQARLVGSRVEIRIPARCSKAEERELVEHFRSKFQRAREADAIDLEHRAAQLAAEFGLPVPASIRWVTNQKHRWGSCTPADRSIRLSNRMVGFPDWVINYVIVHELAHLVVASHNQAFWALVDQYSLTERARGFLMAKGWDEDPEDH